MKEMFSYIDGSRMQEAAPSLAMRCLRMLILVANCWTVLGAALGWLSSLTHVSASLHQDLHWMNLGALMIAFGMFSVAIPLYYVVRSYERSRVHHV